MSITDMPRSQRSVADHTWGLCSAVVLCGLVPLWLLASTAGQQSAPAWPWALAVAVVAGLFYARTVGRGERRLFELTFWLFTYVFMGLAPLVQLRSGRTPGTTPDTDPALNVEAMMVVIVGVLAWLVGAFGPRLLARGPAPGGTRPSAAPRVPRPAPQDIETRVYVMSGLLLVVAAWYIQRIGLGTLFSSRTELFEVQSNIWTLPGTGAVFVNLCTISLIVPLVALLRIVARKRRAHEKVWPLWLLVGVMAVVVLIVMNPVANPRYQFGTVAFTLATAFGVMATRRRFRLFAMGILIMMIAVFPYADRFRYQAGDTAQSKGDVVQALTSGDYDAYAQVNNALAFTQARGTTKGKQALGVAFFWVPRSVWPAKAADSGILLGDFRGYPFKNLSCPMWAELFINGGWLAVMAGMGLLGWIARRADDLSTDWSMPLSPLGCIIPFYMIILYRGSLLQATATFSVLVTLALALRVRLPGTARAQDGDGPRGDGTARPVPATSPVTG